jgi:hypothetical protein
MLASDIELAGDAFKPEHSGSISRRKRIFSGTKKFSEKKMPAGIHRLASFYRLSNYLII